jgi:hypothetical protein
MTSSMISARHTETGQTMTTRPIRTRAMLHPHTPAQARLRDTAIALHPSIVDYHILELAILDISMPSHTDVPQDGLHLDDLTGIEDAHTLANTMIAFAQNHQFDNTTGARHPDYRIAETPHGFIYYKPTFTGDAFLITAWHAGITKADSLHILLGHLAQNGTRYIHHWD